MPICNVPTRLRGVKYQRGAGGATAIGSSALRAYDSRSAKRCRRWRGSTPALSLVLVTLAVSAAPELEEIVVRAEASVVAMQGEAGSVTAVDADAVGFTRASHVHEVMVRVPGVWISRGSGQEHLTAIRSGVLTGAGACGAFLYLENGVPIRPPGFCNVNNLFELATEQAVAIEAMRGPASALFGGNALYGVVNTVTATSAAGWRGSIEAGPEDYLRTMLSGGGTGWRLDALSMSSSGYRDDTGFGQQKLHVGANSLTAGWDVTTTFTATLLNQETGGFVRGFRAYDSDLRRSNPNPEAYRDAWSARATSVWNRALGSSTTLAVTPYLRRSSMAFLQHFLPGQPLEENGQKSGGLRIRFGGGGDWRWTAGADFDAFDARLSERQHGPTRGSPFLAATRPPGTHYDYRVRGLTLAAFYDLGLYIADDLELVASTRLERNGYAYDNRHLDGNTRDDGSACGFGGCLYTRPADRDDAYTNAAGRVGLHWSPTSGRGFHLVAGRGFRPPQTTELYRLQRGQLVTDLNSETLRSVEAGMRGAGERFNYDVAVYAQKAKHLIFRDANGFNVGDGRTRSMGVEFALAWNAGRHTLDIAASHARHRYGFTRDVGGGERIADGNVVDTAPRWLGSVRWRFEGPRAVSEFELVYMGAYFANAANTARYDGHRLLNWRGTWDLTPRARLFVRLLNLLDAAYADRADFAFGGYRYFPGMPRQLYAGVEVKLFE